MPSDTIDFEWEGGESPAALADDLRELEDALDKHLEEALETWALMVESSAKSLAPVMTGRLRSSIASEIRREGQNIIKAVIGSNISYAPYQEFGTRYMEPNPFLRPAIDAHMGDARRLFKSALEKAIKEVS